jgi:predicted O-methyltransferase YrrM
MPSSAARAVLDELTTSGARFHGWAPQVETNWQLNPAALDLLADVLAAGQRTLETGVGYSTVVFAAAGTQHTVVSPFGFEHDRVRAWCDGRGVDASSVTFVVEPSQQALPGLEPSPLDVVLIDGDHAFPAPFIDFQYAASRLVPGGVLVVDDTHLRACRLLDDFLRADRPRWRLHTELPTTTAFERLDGPLVPPGGWQAQPWGARPVVDGRNADPLARVRAAVRLRTRLRGLRARIGGR